MKTKYIILMTIISTAFLLFGCSEAKYSTSGDSSSVSAPSKDPRHPDRILEDHELGTLSRKVDILFALDSTNKRTIRGLQEKMQHFVSDMDGLDWRLGFISGKSGNLIDLSNADGDDDNSDDDSDDSDDGARNYISSEDGDLENLVSENMNYLYGKLKKKRFFSRPSKHVVSSSIKALSANSDFFREDAALAIVYVTPRDEFVRFISPRGGYLGNPYGKNWKLFNAFNLLNTDSQRDKQMIIYGLLSTSRFPNYHRKTIKSKSIARAADTTGGLIGDIDSDDYSNFLRHIVGRTNESIRMIHLSNIPKKESIIIRSEPYHDFEWNLVGSKTIVLNQSLPPGTRITVTYKLKNSEEVMTEDAEQTSENEEDEEDEEDEAPEE